MPKDASNAVGGKQREATIRSAVVTAYEIIPPARTHLMIYTLRFRALHVVMALAFCISQSRAQRPSNADITTRVNEYMGRMASLGYTGGVLVVRDGHPVFQRSYGMADRALGIKADRNTV